MSYLKKIRVHFLALLFIALLVIFSYGSLPSTFFQQDEWQGFAGYIFYQSKGISGIIDSFLPPDAISHFNPLAVVFAWSEFSFFYTTFPPYALLSIFLHLVNIVLLYYFVLDFIGNRRIAFLASLFFGINRISSQAVSWVVNADSYEIPALFILLSLIFFQRFIGQEGTNRKNLFIALTMLIISLLFHENGIFLFLFFPIVFFVSSKSKQKKMSLTFLLMLIFFVLDYVLIRIPFFFGLSNSLPTKTDISRPSFTVYPYRLPSYALKSFAGSIFPERTLISFSEKVVSLAYPQFMTRDNVPNPYAAQTIVFDLVSYVLSVFIISFIFLFMKFIKDKKILEQLKWSLIFIPLSFLPYAFVSGKAGYASIIEPRFFYVGSIGVSILIAIIIFSLLKRFAKKRIARIIIWSIFGMYILLNTYAIKNYVWYLEDMGDQQKVFLGEITSAYQHLPSKVVFFTESDTAYYGMPDEEKILPTEVGFGKILMVWYQEGERFPACLYEDQFLLDLLEEGYRYCGGRGFGYFRHYDHLLASLQENHLSPDVVIAYNWNSKRHQFTNITNYIRTKISKDLIE